MLCDAPHADHYEAELSDFLPEPEVLHNPKFFLPPEPISHLSIILHRGTFIGFQHISYPFSVRLLENVEAQRSDGVFFRWRKEVFHTHTHKTAANLFSHVSFWIVDCHLGWRWLHTTMDERGKLKDMSGCFSSHTIVIPSLCAGELIENLICRKSQRRRA